MGKIIDIKTENPNAFKTLIEVLKEMLNDITIEFIRDDEMNNKSDDETEGSDSDKSTSNSKKAVAKKKR